MANFKCPKCGSEDIKTSDSKIIIVEAKPFDEAYSHKEEKPGILMGSCQKCKEFEPIQHFKIPVSKSNK